MGTGGGKTASPFTFSRRAHRRREKGRKKEEEPRLPVSTSYAPGREERKKERSADLFAPYLNRKEEKKGNVTGDGENSDELNLLQERRGKKKRDLYSFFNRA